MTKGANSPGRFVTLERQTSGHADELFEVLQDPEIYRYISDTPPPTVEWLSKRLQALEAGVSPDGVEQWLNWVVRHRGGQLLGYVQATVYPSGYADVAYVFGSRFWGQEFAYQASEQMLDSLRDQYAVHTVHAVTSSDNGRSIRLLARLGFHRIGHADYPGEPLTSNEVVWRKVLAA